MTEYEWTIHVNDEENAWVVQVNDQLKEIADVPQEEMKNPWQRSSIYKLPKFVKNHIREEKLYTPQVVALGPYHCEDENLNPMEEHKDRALLRFLKRSNRSLQSYFRSLAEVVEDLKEAYNWLDPDLQKDSDAFLRLMIRDGVFMLEILRSSSAEKLERCVTNDPVSGDHGKLYVMPLIRRDMLMLENQLPMLVLHKLLSVEKGLTQVDEDLANQLVFRFFFPKNHNKAPSNCLHVLDMYRKCLLKPKIEMLSNNKPGEMPKSRDDIILIRSAVELAKAGIIIKRKNSTYLTDITFHNGVLNIPMIVVDDTTEPLLLNLVAFERFHVGAGNEVSGYVFFMDNIIDNAQDVHLLSSRHIIQNCIGSDKAAAELFNSLAKDVRIGQECSFKMLCMDINDYCARRWPRYQANLIQTYFRSPWALLSVIAAVCLFALAIQQPVYSALDYYKS